MWWCWGKGTSVICWRITRPTTTGCARTLRSTRMLRSIDLRRQSGLSHQSLGSAVSIGTTFGWHNRYTQPVPRVPLQVTETEYRCSRVFAMTALLEIALLLDCNLGMLPVVENGQIALLQIGPNCGRSSAPSIGRGLPQSSL